MPSSPEKLESVEAVLPGISSRKMMGEYLLYKDGTLFGGIYDDRLLLKITKASASMLPDCLSAFPYEGGGEMVLVPEPYDADLLGRVVDAMCEEISRGRRRPREPGSRIRARGHERLRRGTEARRHYNGRRTEAGGKARRFRPDCSQELEKSTVTAPV